MFYFSYTSAAALSGTLPGCQDKCGDLSIPYPFGISDGCHLPGFEITCNDTDSDPPQAFLGTSNIPVVNISDDVLIISKLIAGDDCYHGGTATRLRKDGPYTFSTSRNLFTAIGCDTIAVFYDPSKPNSSISGCVSICSDKSSITSGTCSGNGCCQSSIPMALKHFDVSLDTISGKIRTMSTDLANISQTARSCNKAFLVDKKQFVFQASFIDNFTMQKLPAVLDWAIGNQTCVRAHKSTSYSCKENTTCVDSTNGPGYRCKCLDGFQGNPYLNGSCQDVDECADTETNDCQMICVNTLGGYQCSCPGGYYIDETNRTACIKISKDKSSLVEIVLGCSLGSLFLVMVGIYLLYRALEDRRIKKLKEKFFEQNGGLLMQQLLCSHERSSTKSARIFTADELERATDKYNESRVLGQGAYGIVYKGILTDNNQIVAIKKSKFMDNNNHQINQMDQFINEVVILSQVIHKNVVKILGCCLETPVPLLVYEYVPGGNLFRHIHQQMGSLSWCARLKIATETADALSCLHSATERPILHRDVKSANILLDDKYMAKISDFGASRLIPQDTDCITTMVQGTLGYLDPEYMHNGVLTEKSDVYSFGVLLAELLTGELSISNKREEAERNLAVFFLMKMKADSLHDILEPRVKNEAKQEQLQGVAELIKRCLNLKGDERPTMKTVALELGRLKSQQDDEDSGSLDEWPLNNENGVVLDEISVVKTKRFYNWNRFEDESLLGGSVNWSYTSSDQLQVGSSSSMPLPSSTMEANVMLAALELEKR